MGLKQRAKKKLKPFGKQGERIETTITPKVGKQEGSHRRRKDRCLKVVKKKAWCSDRKVSTRKKGEKGGKGGKKQFLTVEAM